VIGLGRLDDRKKQKENDMESKTEIVIVRDLAASDYPMWIKMWKDYCSPIELSDEITDLLWNRLMDEKQIGLPEGLVAVDSQNQQPIGFCHYLRHSHTWGTGWWCYCEDLYVLPEARNKKVGRALLQFLLERAKERGWDSIYGETDKSNPAQFLYGRFTNVDDRLMFSLDLRESKA